MKNKLLITTLLLTSLSLFSSDCLALTTYPAFGYPKFGHFRNFRAGRNNYRGTYNPFGKFYNPYFPNGGFFNSYPRNNFYNGYYNNYNGSYWNSAPITRGIRSSLFSLFNKKSANNSPSTIQSNDNGSLTGYSTPINSSALDLIDNQNTNINPNTNYNPINQMKLFHNPQSGQEYYSADGQYYKDLKSTGGTGSVNIIYD